MRSNDDDGRDDFSQTSSSSRQADPTAAPIYGNFQRYYHIRNPVNSTAADDAHDSSHPAIAVDSRVSAILRYLRQHYTANTTALVPHSNVKVLDIGCNSGKVTIELAQTLPKLLQQRGRPAGGYGLQILGVDIDPSLIGQARQAAAVARSRYRPEQIEGTDDEGESTSLPPESVYFPSVFPLLYGPINDEHRHALRRQTEPATNSTATAEKDRAPAPAPTLHLCPPNLHFLAADWTHPSAINHTDTHGYSIVLALSITKWIHIQQGDTGVVRFFARIATTLHAGALLFLERQEWSSYHSARNMDASMRGKIRRLQLRPEGDFDWWLETLGLRLVDEIGFGRGVGFARPLQVFRKGEVVVEVEEMQPFAWVARGAATNRASVGVEQG
ncbi:uncharacterized protein SRS1_12075 [Sporisorium reilianum f. sp. reilianum]|uniref:RNA methyltransferase n=1 Tax=Sporisorium reilianum f. sp. reilianum TaxID=72559 RepID=A0A2N8U808_9BASI|nr:uncharacterized protein SRS1_12075 [Sporisorium reilianum f. sp. reilianum]